jgi:hypothetical protein
MRFSGDARLFRAPRKDASPVFSKIVHLFLDSIRYLNSVSQFLYFVLSDGIEILKSKFLKFPRTLLETGISFLKKHSGIFS